MLTRIRTTHAAAAVAEAVVRGVGDAGDVSIVTFEEMRGLRHSGSRAAIYPDQFGGVGFNVCVSPLTRERRVVLQLPERAAVWNRPSCAGAFRT